MNVPIDWVKVLLMPTNPYPPPGRTTGHGQSEAPLRFRLLLFAFQLVLAVYLCCFHWPR